ncbi:MAG TPA: amino acid ABC transporter ATP-binding protein [Clostridia bacterium]|jgi:polar amino acid transport system ATP-binding protein|nr:amino acid ABC transporter ATP-binding protein [Clostridia bacterium]
MALLQVKNMRKDFDRLEVLKGIDFELDKGEVLAIIGSSGSGKTTLLRCLNFLETPDKGQIYIDGELIFDAEKDREVSDADLREKRLNFGLVFQSFNLFPQYSALKNVTLAPSLFVASEIKQKKATAYKEYLKNIFVKGSLKKFREERAILGEQSKNLREDIEKRALKLLDKVGLSDKVDNFPCELSGGQCQRLAIARALALNPKILCFDEPTSALDPELTGEVLKVIKNLKSKETTMIIVTHEMEFARNVADKVIYMANGIIEEMGTPEEVFGNPKSEKTRAFLLKDDLSGGKYGV